MPHTVPPHVDLTQLNAYDYPLPEDLIAKYPLDARDQSRMLVVHRQSGTFSHRQFAHLADFLNPGDLLVVNNAKVIPARLIGHRQGRTGQVEVLLMHPENEAKTRWQVLMRPARKLPPGTVVEFDGSPLTATIVDRQEAGRGIVELAWPDGQSLDTLLEATGQMPIPPYMDRKAEPLDTERYQTVYAKVSGAQAAPTAGLHFTPAVLQRLAQKGVEQAEVTLHVSAGTFRPVQSEDVTAHQMDAERYTVPAETAEAVAQAKANGKRVIAVGTTVMKTLESAAQTNQGRVVAGSGWSNLFIRPGFAFQVVDAMLTNFHLPKSTLLMLVSAFAGRDLVLSAYHAAIAERYRFYSYGDCMFIE